MGHAAPNARGPAALSGVVRWFGDRHTAAGFGGVGSRGCVGDVQRGVLTIPKSASPPVRGGQPASRLRNPLVRVPGLRRSAAVARRVQQKSNEGGVSPTLAASPAPLYYSRRR